MTETPPALTREGLQPLLEFAVGLDLAAPDAADRLEQAFPFTGPYVQGIGALLCAGIDAGDLCDRGELPVRFSRVWRADDAGSFSADAVLMTGAGPLHEHPLGEIDLCFALEGEPTFDGHPAGWVTYGPGSRHVPTVRSGMMAILYLLPGGAIRFVKG